MAWMRVSAAAGISWYEKLADVEMADAEDVAQMEQ